MTGPPFWPVTALPILRRRNETRLDVVTVRPTDYLPGWLLTAGPTKGADTSPLPSTYDLENPNMIPPQWSRHSALVTNVSRNALAYLLNKQ